jgi:aspartate-semialdehyde dehydrogenase
MKKIGVGILGATGMAGQRYLQLLEKHPTFEVRVLVASQRSAGKTYGQAVEGRWLMQTPIPENIRDLKVESLDSPELVKERCSLVFSAIDSEPAREWEPRYAAAGLKVVSNASSYRKDPLVPVLIPELNPHHLDILPLQREIKGFQEGFLTVKPNCSLQSYLLPLYVLHRRYVLEEVVVTTLQALSGAGYPGVASLNALDNCVPYIAGEEEKSEQEPLKILGEVGEQGILSNPEIKISAHCNRVPVLDGHLACVSAKFREAPELAAIPGLWEEFRARPQELSLPSAPGQPIRYLHEPDRPQTRLDRDFENGMGITVGRLRSCNVHQIRFTCLSHNTIRGAAGGGILIAELMKASNLL